jgi:transposase
MFLIESNMPRYKDYIQNQAALIPARLDAFIDKKDLVWVIDKIINDIDSALLDKPFSHNTRKGGCPPYHPRMMLKILIYAYCNKIYSCRKIARALKRDVAFMWLSGRQYPDFHTINRFRGVYFKDTLESAFAHVVTFLVEHGYIHTKDYFVDGTKIEADANRFSHVWKKNTNRYAEKVKERALEIMREVDQINAEEDRLYGKHDLPETGSLNELDSDALSKAASDLAKSINGDISPKEVKKNLEKAGN